MKKTILALIILTMVSTPCLAEVETDGLFSVDGTLWGSCFIGCISIPPFIGISCEAEFGFYQGKQYLCAGNNCISASDTSAYNDLVVVSIAYYIDIPDGGNWIEDDWGSFLAIMQPIGIGVFTMIGYSSGGGGGWVSLPPALLGAMGIMFKINDNWTPPEVE